MRALPIVIVGGDKIRFCPLSLVPGPQLDPVVVPRLVPAPHQLRDIKLERVRLISNGLRCLEIQDRIGTGRLAVPGDRLIPVG